METCRVFIEGVYVYAVCNGMLFKAPAGYTLKCIGDLDAGYPDDVPQYIINFLLEEEGVLNLSDLGEVVYCGQIYQD